MIKANLFVCLFIALIYLLIYIYLFICLFVYLSFYLFIYLSITSWELLDLHILDPVPYWTRAKEETGEKIKNARGKERGLKESFPPPPPPLAFKFPPLPVFSLELVQHGTRDQTARNRIFHQLRRLYKIYIYIACVVVIYIYMYVYKIEYIYH